ncbi:MAG: hypothetical protein ACHQIK_03190, partial [Candidatus Acidiferrales bacterium]
MKRAKFFFVGARHAVPFRKTQDVSPAHRARQRFTGACRPISRKNCLPQGKQTAASNAIRDKPAAYRVFSRVSAPRLSPNF